MALASGRPPPPPPPARLVSPSGKTATAIPAAIPSAGPGHLTPRTSEDGAVGLGQDDPDSPSAAVPAPVEARIEKMLVAHFYSGRNCSVRGFVANNGQERYLLFFLDVAAVQALDNDHVVAMGDLCNMPNFKCDRLVFCLRQADIDVLRSFVQYLVKFMGCRLETVGTMFGYRGPTSDSEWVYYSMEVACADA